MYTEEEIQERINEIDSEIKEISHLRDNNRISSEDIEDISDNYQFHLEWGYALSELRDERAILVEERNKLHMVDMEYN